MTSLPLWNCSASDLHAQVLAGACSVEQVVASHLERIAQREPEVQAWSWLDAEGALAEARRIDLNNVNSAPGALAGVTIGIKDIIDTAAMPTAYGSKLYRGHRPRRDAALVTRLREAGAVILGKTVTTEFAYAWPGPTRNPHDPTRTPGGSSSGSAAAVAAGMAGVAISSQTGGSTIRPAAFCGVVGFKPSIDLIDATGMKPLAPSSDTVGLHARTVEDIALVFAVLATAPPPPPSKPLRSLRIAWFPGPHARQASAPAATALARVRQLLLEHGVQLASPELAEQDVALLGDYNRLIMAVEGASSLEQEYRLYSGVLAAPTVRLIESGRSTPATQYHEALAFIARRRVDFDTAMEDFDALLTFSAPGVAPPFTDEGTGDSLFNRAWSALGVPCLNLPCGFADGLPLGVQLVARSGADHALLALTRDLESLLAPAQQP